VAIELALDACAPSPGVLLPGRLLDHASQDRTNRIQALLDNRQDNQSHVKHQAGQGTLMPLSCPSVGEYFLYGFKGTRSVPRAWRRELS